jgi:hypothetical protein
MEEQKIIRKRRKTTKKMEEQKIMAELKCSECGSIQDIPQHCGQPMHKEGENVVCWMGASCGCLPIPEHCGKPMDVIE